MPTFPPKNFIPTDSTIPGITIYKPKTDAPPTDAPIVEFKCPQCQATTAYSIADGGLKCAHCGYYGPPAQKTVGKHAEEFEFTVETMAAAAHGWGTARQVLHCQQCGASTTLPPGQLTHTCPFCGSNQVLQQAAAQDNLRPRFLLPFQIDATACAPAVHAWLGSSWMTPKALQNLASLTEFNSLYAPFWTFDAITQADWKAEVGHQETTRYYDSHSKQWKTRTKTVWHWESGHARQNFDDLIIPGTKQLSHVLLTRLQDYDTQQLVPYDAAYLAGFMAQGYDIPLEDAWERGRHKMRTLTRDACRAQASTTQIRNFSMKLDFSHESWRYILAPLYLTVYHYENETYQVMINGQTGKVVGQRPVAWGKVWLAILGMLLPGVLFTLLTLILFITILPVGIMTLVVTLIAFGIGGIFAVRTYRKAKELDDV